MRRLVLLSLVLMCGAASFAPAASAYERAGRAWPDGRITYFSEARGYAASVDRAARVWNQTGVGIRFVKTSRREARVVFSYGGRRCEGAAYAGYIGRRRQSPVSLGAGCGRSLITLTAVHEMGHVLGLGHENDRCARMNPAFDGSGTPNHCASRPTSYWLQRPLLGDDVRGARARYR